MSAHDKLPDLEKLRQLRIEAELNTLKTSLNLARRVGDRLHAELAEDGMNYLLDRYHTYHVSQREGKS